MMRLLLNRFPAWIYCMVLGHDFIIKPVFVKGPVGHIELEDRCRYCDVRRSK